MRYKLADPDRYDDEFGTGFDHAEVYGQITCEGMFICDCWITNAAGEVHPGLAESPVPVRIDDVIPTQQSLRKTAREDALRSCGLDL